MNENKKKILIVGHSLKEYVLAKALSENGHKVFVAPGYKEMAKFAELVDIREDNPEELLTFAVRNEIDLTIAPEKITISTDIAEVFNANSQLIFAPNKNSSNFACSKAFAKKFLYKLHIPTPKFGIFDKPAFANDYIKNAKYPLIISADSLSENSVQSVCTNYNIAKTCLSDMTFQNEEKVVVEDYQYGHKFSFYVITDGYQALPLGVVGDYKFLGEGDSGLYTSGSGAYLPDYKVSFDDVQELMETVVFKILDEQQRLGQPYLGILGLDCVLKNNNEILIIGFEPFLKDHDVWAVINSVDVDLLELFVACANGSFADDYEEIPIKDLSTVSCVLFSQKENSVISGLEKLSDETELAFWDVNTNEYFEKLTVKGRNVLVSQTAATLARAKQELYENIEEISFSGKKYRKDLL